MFDILGPLGSGTGLKSCPQAVEFQVSEDENAGDQMSESVQLPVSSNSPSSVAKPSTINADAVASTGAKRKRRRTIKNVVPATNAAASETSDRSQLSQPSAEKSSSGQTNESDPAATKRRKRVKLQDPNEAPAAAVAGEPQAAAHLVPAGLKVFSIVNGGTLLHVAEQLKIDQNEIPLKISN